MSWWLWWPLFVAACCIGGVIGGWITAARDSFVIALLVVGAYVAGVVWIFCRSVPA